MVINPVYFLFALYFFSMLFTFQAGQELEGFYILSEFHYVSGNSYFYAFLMEVFVILFLFALYFIFRDTRDGRRIWLGSYWAYFVIFNQLAYIVFVGTTGAGVAGSGFSFDGVNLFNYYFIAISPDLLAFITIPLIKSKRLAIALLFLLLVSFLMRGWLGGVIFFIILYLVRFYPVRISSKNLIYICLISILMLFMLPLFISIKWGVRLGYSWAEIIEGAVLGYDIDQVVNSAQIVIERFSHINYTAYVFDNLEMLRLDYEHGLFKHYLQNGILYETYCRIASSCYADINSHLVAAYIDPQGKSWNLDIGIAGWFFILGLDSVLFVGLWMVVFVFLRFYVFKFFGKRYFDLFFLFTLIYFFNSWFSPYYNLLLYLFVFYFVCLISYRPRSGCVCK